MTRRTRSPLLLAVLALLVACGGDGDGPTAPRPTEIRVADASLELTRGGSVGIEATVVDASGQAIPGSVVTYESSDPDVAEVSAAGVVTAVGGLGEATITARSGTLSQTVQVQVVGRGHPEGILAAKVTLPTPPSAIAAAGDRAVVVADGVHVGTFWPASFSAAIPGTSSGFGVAMDRAGSRAFVCCGAERSIVVLDVANARVEKSIGSLPQVIVLDVAASPDGRRVWAGGFDGRIYAFDVGSGEAIATIDPQTSMRRLRMDPAGLTLYATHGEGRVSVIFTLMNTVATTLQTLGSGPMAISPDNRVLYFANQALGYLVIHPQQPPGPSVQVSVDCFANDIALSPDGTQLWAACSQGTVIGVDLASRTVVSRLAVGGDPRRLAFDAGGMLGVANLGGWVDVIR